MNLQAIVYTSNTGHTAAYASLLSKACGVPALTLAEAGSKLSDGAAVVYLGWLCAGTVQGLKKAEKAFDVRAVGGVGMGPEDAGQTAELVKRYGRADRPVFYLNGGFEMEKLRGVYRFMMRLMAKTVRKSLEKKPNRTAAEDETLELMLHGGNRVNEEALAPMRAWLAEQA